LDIAVMVGGTLLGLAIEHAVGGAILGDVASTLLLTGLTAWLAPRVSYRRRDALWWLTGVGGLWLFFIVAWRVAYLPHRDWPPRDDELRHADYLRDPQYAGIWRMAVTPNR
jgi:hypothetical protein